MLSDDGIQSLKSLSFHGSFCSEDHDESFNIWNANNFPNRNEEKCEKVTTPIPQGDFLNFVSHNNDNSDLFFREDFLDNEEVFIDENFESTALHSEKNVELSKKNEDEFSVKNEQSESKIIEKVPREKITESQIYNTSCVTGEGSIEHKPNYGCVRSASVITDVEDLKDQLRTESRNKQEIDQCYNTLQHEYDDLLRKYAEAENTIDAYRIGSTLLTVERPATPRHVQSTTFLTAQNAANNLCKTASAPNTMCFFNSQHLSTISALRLGVDELHNDVEVFQTAVMDGYFADQNETDGMFAAIRNEYDTAVRNVQRFKKDKTLSAEVTMKEATNNNKWVFIFEESESCTSSEKKPAELDELGSFEAELYKIGVRLDEINEELGHQKTSKRSNVMETTELKCWEAGIEDITQSATHSSSVTNLHKQQQQHLKQQHNLQQNEAVDERYLSRSLKVPDEQANNSLLLALSPNKEKIEHLKHKIHRSNQPTRHEKPISQLNMNHSKDSGFVGSERPKNTDLNNKNKMKEVKPPVTSEPKSLSGYSFIEEDNLIEGCKTFFISPQEQVVSKESDQRISDSSLFTLRAEVQNIGKLVHHMKESLDQQRSHQSVNQFSMTSPDQHVYNKHSRTKSSPEPNYEKNYYRNSRLTKSSPEGAFGEGCDRHAQNRDEYNEKRRYSTFPDRSERRRRGKHENGEHTPRSFHGESVDFGKHIYEHSPKNIDTPHRKKYTESHSCPGKRSSSTGSIDQMRKMDHLERKVSRIHEELRRSKRESSESEKVTRLEIKLLELLDQIKSSQIPHKYDALYLDKVDKLEENIALRRTESLTASPVRQHASPTIKSANSNEHIESISKQYIKRIDKIEERLSRLSDENDSLKKEVAITDKQDKVEQLEQTIFRLNKFLEQLVANNVELKQSAKIEILEQKLNFVTAQLDTFKQSGAKSEQEEPIISSKSERKLQSTNSSPIQPNVRKPTRSLVDFELRGSPYLQPSLHSIRDDVERPVTPERKFSSSHQIVNSQRPLVLSKQCQTPLYEDRGRSSDLHTNIIRHTPIQSRNHQRSCDVQSPVFDQSVPRDSLNTKNVRSSENLLNRQTCDPLNSLPDSTLSSLELHSLKLQQLESKMNRMNSELLTSTNHSKPSSDLNASLDANSKKLEALENKVSSIDKKLSLSKPTKSPTSFYENTNRYSYVRGHPDCNESSNNTLRYDHSSYNHYQSTARRNIDFNDRSGQRHHIYTEPSVSPTFHNHNSYHGTSYGHMREYKGSPNMKRMPRTGMFTYREYTGDHNMTDEQLSFSLQKASQAAMVMERVSRKMLYNLTEDLFQRPNQEL